MPTKELIIVAGPNGSRKSTFVARRFSRSLENFWQRYREIADYWYVVYNSETDYEWIASGDPESTVAHNADEFDRLLKMAGAENDKADS